MEFVAKSPENWMIGLNVDTKYDSKGEPVILMYLPMDNNEERVIEIPIDKFHALRQRTALLLKNFLVVKERIEC